MPVSQNVFALYQACEGAAGPDGRADGQASPCSGGIRAVPVSQNVVALYQACGELLAQAGRADEAIALLREGIRARLRVSQNVVALYQACGELLAQAGRADGRSPCSGRDARIPQYVWLENLGEAAIRHCLASQDRALCSIAS